MATPPPLRATDRESLRALAKQPGAESMRPLLDRYLNFVHAAALRRAGNPEQAAEITRSVFVVFARRARKLRKKTVLAAWLHEMTGLACRKLVPRAPKHRKWWFRSRKVDALPAEASLWSRVAPEFDAALDRLSPKLRQAVLVCSVLRFSPPEAAQILRRRERRMRKHETRGLKLLTKRLRKRCASLDNETLARLCAMESCPPAVPEALAADVLATVEESVTKKPRLRLARRVLRVLAWRRWTRRIAVGVPAIFLCLAGLLAAALYADSRTGSSHFIAWFITWSVKHEGAKIPGLAQAARRWPTNATPTLKASAVRKASDVYQSTNVWPAHLKFSREQWKAAQPRNIGPMPNFMRPDGIVLLRNPKAERSGLAGVIGFEFDWTSADFELGGLPFRNSGVRIKGNGTFLGSLYGWKRSFKVGMNRFVTEQKLGDIGEVNLTNLIDDRSYMADALAYELFRAAGVPAPRTAYAWLSISVDDKWNDKPLGLYLLVEPINSAFAAEHFGSKKAPIFKPVTYDLFADLGNDWSAYADTYDLKTKATSEQQQRLIDFAHLVSHASDEEFAQRLPGFLDLDEFARFLAGEVFLSSYDGILSDGQNFYLYLDPRSNRFGFIPWDLDHAWGAFPFIGNNGARERASIWHPWVGKNRFLERVMLVEKFRQVYRASLEEYSREHFVPSRWFRRIDEVANVIRGPIAAESSFRLERFEQAVSDKRANPSATGSETGADRPVHQLKRFIENRARSVRQQLDGKSKGMVLQRNR